MIFLLLVLFQIKHFVCDYPSQGQYMLGKFKSGKEWILPLTAHASVHALATFLISIFFVSKLGAFGLALLDFAFHFAMDRVKASPNLLGRYKALSASEYPTVNFMSKGLMPAGVQVTVEEATQKEEWAKQRLKENVYFWWALGLDQMVHHLTHYIIIYFLS